jgi:hypothetical protein
MDKHTQAIVAIIDWLNTYAQDLGGARMVAELSAHRAALMEMVVPTSKPGREQPIPSRRADADDHGPEPRGPYTGRGHIEPRE